MDIGRKAPLEGATDVQFADTYGFKLFGKRFFDIAVGCIMLVLFLPLMLMIALLILIYDGKGVIYPHERVGRRGQTFRCLKFRTMVKDSDARLHQILAIDQAAAAEWHATRKLRKDPRILPVVGKFLRQSSLDELPQIINVIRGEMSLVGPRPVVREELVHYGDAASLYLSVRPGLTGPWQIGGRSDSTYNRRVQQDIDYIQNWDLVSDVMIVLRTAAVLLRFKSPGAY